jgi:hypothetical protein
LVPRTTSRPTDGRSSACLPTPRRRVRREGAIDARLRVAPDCTRCARPAGHADVGRPVSSLRLSDDSDLSRTAGARDEHRPHLSPMATGRLQVPRQRPRRRVATSRPRPLPPTMINHVWAYDFVFDTCADGRKLKCLTVMDEFTRECLAIDVAGGSHGKPVASEIIANNSNLHGATTMVADLCRAGLVRRATVAYARRRCAVRYAGTAASRVAVAVRAIREPRCPRRTPGQTRNTGRSGDALTACATISTRAPSESASPSRSASPRRRP